jgi:hypothetical protein
VYTDQTLNFDEPGGPVGVVPTDSWAALGLVEMQAGDGVPQVGDWDAANGGWGLGDGLSFFGNFGVFMTFDSDLAAISFEVWDPSGPPGPFGGGLAIFLFDDGVEVASGFFTPAWGGIGDSWYDITVDGGDAFDEVRVLGFGFFPTTYMDNISWDMAAAGPMGPFMDIKPGSCPNSFNRKSNGVLPVALLGTDSVDIAQVDFASLQLSRADGVGGSVMPNDGPPGPSPSYEDVSAPFMGEECECAEMDPDGSMDLVLHFRTQDTVAALEMNGLPAGALVPLVLQGTMLDGTPFQATDCVRLVPPGAAPASVAVASTLPGAWIDATPLDCTLDGGGFAGFARCYSSSTQVTLIAAPTQQGRAFAGWAVEGRPGLVTENALTIDLVKGKLDVVAVYLRNPHPVQGDAAAAIPSGTDLSAP